MAENNERDRNSFGEDRTSMEVIKEDVSEFDKLITEKDGGIKVDEDIYIPPPVKTISVVDTSGPRLVITKIVNENFKSYGGTQVVGPFHKCFSAIVGPNGSGKSNVIDSMLFVFGYRASKIRSKKISVLIHNSSEKQNINSCTVSVHFQQIIDKPGMDYDVVPNSEFVISRTAFRDNSSHYELDKKKVQFKEIGKLLRSYGVDLDHNRFLILQGEVEQIAMMKPKAQTENETGMLEYLEDIIGTYRYKEPLEKLSEKVEHLTEYRTEKLNRLRIVEKEKAALEEPMQEAVQYLIMENTVTKLQHQLYCYRRFETIKEVEQHESKMNELDEDLSKLKGKMMEIHNDMAEKNKIIAEKNKKWESLQNKKDETVAKFNKIRKQDESLHAELVETNKRRKANIATLKNEKSKLEELRRVPEKSAKDIEECNRAIAKHEENKKKEEAVLETLMVDLRKKTEPLLNERSQLEKQLISLRKDVDEAQATLNIAQSELELYTSVESTEKEKLEKLKDSLKSATENLKERKEQLQILENDIPASEHELKKAQKELETVESSEIQITSELKRMRISFEEQRSAMQANTSRNKVLDSLMREKREGRIPGVLGRLGDLGAIDAKYDVAISTACGPLDNIVVDTVDTAQKCIAFLRQNDIGRATLIPLEKQQHLLSRCAQKIKTPENVSRLFDLIRVEDQKILPAFYYGLQDTLVVNDLEQATRIAYGQQRFRVVTLKGELIELSGTMSGGGRSVMRGRMGQKLARSELSSGGIEKLQSDLNRANEQCNQLRATSQALENQIQTLSVSLRNMRAKQGKLEIEAKALKEQTPSLIAQIKIQEKKAKDSVSDPKKVQQLKRVVEAAKKTYDKVNESSKTVENKVKSINANIEELSGIKVKNQQKKIAELNRSIDTMKAEVCRLQVAVTTSERNVKKLEQRIESLENDVHNCEQRVRDIEKEKHELEEQGKECLQELEKLEEALSERDEAMSSLKEELTALQNTENKMRAIKIDLDQKLKECKNVAKELTQKVPDLTRRISALRLQAIPGESSEELKELTEEQFNEIDEKALLGNLQKAKKKMPKEIPNMHLIDEYREKDELYLKRATELEKITTERNRMRDIYETARRRRIEEFLAGFSVITDKLKEMYQMITLGGDAELELVDSLDPFSEGIAFSVRPPKKSWKNICNLSGGEKTLSSLALVFALHHYKPTPLYFMDEIDAALDFKNVSIVGNYIKERTKNAQFIVISLRSNMFELADFLVGIYKTYNCTKSITVDVQKYYSRNGIAPPTQITSKSMYSSQLQKLSVHSQQSTSSTQVTNNGHDKDGSVEMNENHLSGLPELGLCATPEKSIPQKDSTGDSPSLNDNGICKKPVTKKRRL